MLYIGMKKMIIALGVIILILVVFQSFMVASTNNTEKQAYKVIKKEDDFEIRYYPPATFATIQSSAKNYRELSGNGFRKIAGYIFGNNESSSKIAMTTPVHMDISDEGSSMSFVMPEKYKESDLPKPKDAGVHIVKSSPQYVAVISFGGYADDESIQENRNLLLKLIQKKGIKVTGEYSFLGYNAPFQFWSRKNEVVIPIDWKE